MVDTPDGPTLADCRTEIERLHDFFVAYYTGETADISPMEAALAPDFEMVSPGGDVLDREEVIELVRSKRNGYDSGEFDIAIYGVELLDSAQTHAVARYEEHQTGPDGDDARVSTVLFRTDKDTPAGRSWVTVHETWLDAQ